MSLTGSQSGSAAALTPVGSTGVEVSWDGRRRGVIRLADAVKPTSAEAIGELVAMGITPVLLTGDNPAVAARVAGRSASPPRMSSPVSCPTRRPTLSRRCRPAVARSPWSAMESMIRSPCHRRHRDGHGDRYRRRHRGR